MSKWIGSRWLAVFIIGGATGAIGQPSATWFKLCPTTQSQGVAEICFTGRLMTLAGEGPSTVEVVLIEPREGAKKLRLSLPRVLQPHGQIAVDQNPSNSCVTITCSSMLCLVDFNATAPLIDEMKSGSVLRALLIDRQGNPIELAFPLQGFRAANEGAETQPHEVERRNSKLQEDLQKKADEIRKKMERMTPEEIAEARTREVERQAKQEADLKEKFALGPPQPCAP